MAESIEKTIIKTNQLVVELVEEVSIEEKAFIEKPPVKKSSSAPVLDLFEPELPEKSRTESCCAFCRPIKGYAYGLLFVLSVCLSSIFLKVCTSMNVFNHTLIRYVIQFVLMLFFVKTSHSNLFTGYNHKTIGLLTVRGLFGFSALCFSYLSLKYLDVSDVESVQNSSLLITAILGRIFLKEKMSMFHLVAILFTIVGVVLILRPTVLFGIETDLEKLLKLNLTAVKNGTIGTGSKYSKESLITSVIGVSAVIISAILTSISHITIKKLCIYNIHFSVNSMYPVIFGLPFSAILSVWLFILESKCQFKILPLHVLFSCCSGLISTVGLIFLNKALMVEDTTRIAVIRTSGVLFSFIFQYAFLGVETDLLGIIGALCIIIGTLTVVFIKLYDNSRLNNILIFKF